MDSTGPHLYSIHPHGSTDKLPYTTMGSGSLAAMAVFEGGFKPNMEVRPVCILRRKQPAGNGGQHPCATP